MKVLSLWQPHASLCVLINPETGRPYKTIETRSWSTKYRGPLALQAARRRPDEAQVGDWVIFQQDGQSWMANHATGSFSRVPRSNGRAGGAFDGPLHALPLGAIVTTCTLVDVVPMTTHAHLGDPDCLVVHGDGTLDLALVSEAPPPGPPNIVRLDEPDIPDGVHLIRDVSDQEPYGLFTPGRFAWLLADVEPVDPPVPFKAGQGLTKTWEP